MYYVSEKFEGAMKFSWNNSVLWVIASPVLDREINYANFQLIKFVNSFLSKKPCFLKDFRIFFNLSWILALQLTKVVFSLVLRIFWHPWHPWGCVNSGDISFLVFVFYDSTTWRIFFIILKLKPDVTFIDLTCIKVTI